MSVFCKRGNSPWWYLFVFGASVWALSAVVGTSMISVGHLLGAVVAGIGLVGLGVRGEVDRALLLPTKPVFLFLFFWVGVGHWVHLWTRHAGGSYGGDVLVFVDLLQRLARGGSYYSTPIGEPGLADHFTPSMMLLVPLFWLSPSYLWVLAAKVVAFLLCPWLLYALGTRVLGRESRCLWVLPSLWLIHTPLAYTLIYDFQPTVLAPPLVLSAFILAFDRRWALLVPCLLLLAGLKEDMPLAGVAVGVFLVLERGERRWGIAIAAAATLLGIFVFFVAMPYFADGRPLLQHSRFDPLAYPFEKVAVFVVLLASVGGLPLVRPRALLFALPCYAVHLVSGFGNMFSFRYHYHAFPLAALFVAALYGLRDVERGEGLPAKAKLRTKHLAAAFLGALLLALNGMLPWYSVRLFWPSSTALADARALLALRSAIPDDRALYTLQELGLRLSPHPDLHLLDWHGDWDDDVAVRLSKEDSPHVVLLTRRPLERSEPDVYLKPARVMDTLVEEGRYRARDLGAVYRLYEPTNQNRARESAP